MATKCVHHNKVLRDYYASIQAQQYEHNMIVFALHLK